MNIASGFRTPPHLEQQQSQQQQSQHQLASALPGSLLTIESNAASGVGGDERKRDPRNSKKRAKRLRRYQNLNTATAAISNITMWANRMRTLEGYPSSGSSSRLGSTSTKTVEDVYLGGSSNSTWRDKVVIPRLDRSHVMYYNPQAEEFTAELLPVLAAARKRAFVLLYVIDDQTRGLDTMVEVVEMVCSGHNVVLATLDMRPGALPDGSTVSPQEAAALNNARKHLREVVARFGGSVFQSVQRATREVLGMVAARKARLVSNASSSAMTGGASTAGLPNMGASGRSMTPSLPASSGSAGSAGSYNKGHRQRKRLSASLVNNSMTINKH
eukprot:TRINITY_DN67114_c8_g4_i1.p1 TRINITY_DN67114_c8_g4~~TRINITY_DN67114_c8_g4_i1.p1  ORF type:complete len:340 (+),score=154.46 TRINITY_DN67114_c8_g4_i1:36-1022(+)